MAMPPVPPPNLGLWGGEHVLSPGPYKRYAPASNRLNIYSMPLEYINAAIIKDFQLHENLFQNKI